MGHDNSKWIVGPVWAFWGQMGSGGLEGIVLIHVWRPGHCLVGKIPQLPGSRGGRGQQKVCVPKIGVQFLARLVKNILFLPEENFSGVGGRVGRPRAG